MNYLYDRELVLRTRFNNSVHALLGVPQVDYYSRLSIDQVLELKATLSDINNIVTLRLAVSLGEWICNRFNLPSSKLKEIGETISASKPNANGYDLELHDPNIIAEVKCNIPINGGNAYGAQQRDGLIRDIKGLLNGKSKSARDISNSVKLLALYDAATVRNASKRLVHNLPQELNKRIVIDPQEDRKLDSMSVFIIYLK